MKASGLQPGGCLHYLKKQRVKDIISSILNFHDGAGGVASG
jgi:hypothetical protein